MNDSKEKRETLFGEVSEVRTRIRKRKKKKEDSRFSRKNENRGRKKDFSEKACERTLAPHP